MACVPDAENLAIFRMPVVTTVLIVSFAARALRGCDAVSLTVSRHPMPTRLLP